MVKRYGMVTEYNKFACEDQVVPVEDNQGEYVKFEDYAKLQEEVEALKYWRKLALQFDGHRMNAMSMLKLVATGNFDMEEVRKFIAAAPVSGDEHLREIRAEAGLKGYKACLRHIGYDDPDWQHDANQYADSIRQEKK